MAKFNKFEEIQAWRKAREVTLLVYKITSNEAFSKDFGLKDPNSARRRFDYGEYR